MRRRIRFGARASLAAAVACGCGGGAGAGATSTPDASVGPVANGADAAADRSAEASSESCLVDSASLDAFEGDLDGSDAASPCITCIVQTCGMELTACSSDCTCDPLLIAFVACAADGGTAITCAQPLATADASTVQALTECVGGVLAGGTGLGCLLQCGVGRTGSDAAAPEDAAPEADAAIVTDAAIDVADAPAGD
jgi:hypothetical protein